MKLFAFADRFVKSSDWKTISLLKLCLLSLGIVIGTLLPEQYRTVARVVCGITFAATLVPLMAKLISVLRSR